MPDHAYARTVPRDIKWAVADRLRPVWVGDPNWRPSDDDKEHWRAHGWILIRNSVDHAAIDRLKAEVQTYRERHRTVTTNATTGEGLRIGLLHAGIRLAREMGFNHQARTFLRWAFDEDPVLFGSLTFDIGSEQEPHIDAAFFYTQPETSMAGVWTAFEDIHEQSGPLFYVDGSHKWPRLKAADALAEAPELKARLGARPTEPDRQLSDEVYRAYSAKLERVLTERSAVKSPAMLDKGDVFIWHPWLVHGGLPRVNRDLTRRSMVVHYIGASARMWDQDSFFLRGDRLDQVPAIKHPIRKSRGRPYVWHPAPVNFSMGNGHFEA
jgi:hypothetical protein